MEQAVTGDQPKVKEVKKIYYRKRVNTARLVQKIKLWPSRKGILHGIKTINIQGNLMEITTHCRETFIIHDSRNSRASRWLRNKWYREVCPKCGIPAWKVEKYAATYFKRGWGSLLHESGAEVPANTVEEFK